MKDQEKAWDNQSQKKHCCVVQLPLIQMHRQGVSPIHLKAPRLLQTQVQVHRLQQVALEAQLLLVIVLLSGDHVLDDALPKAVIMKSCMDALRDRLFPSTC